MTSEIGLTTGDALAQFGPTTMVVMPCGEKLLVNEHSWVLHDASGSELVSVNELTISGKQLENGAFVSPAIMRGTQGWAIQYPNGDHIAIHGMSWADVRRMPTEDVARASKVSIHRGPNTVEFLSTTMTFVVPSQYQVTLN